MAFDMCRIINIISYYFEEKADIIFGMIPNLIYALLNIFLVVPYLVLVHIQDVCRK